MDLTPSVTLIIAAYNEEQHIDKRLDNVLSLDYPRNALQVIVASDGSTDRTEEIVSKYAGRGVWLLRLPRLGKVRALNAAVRHAGGDVLVFSDANAFYRPDAIRKLVRNFADPDVGGVSGNTIFVTNPNSESTARGEFLYWSYDQFLKSMESRTGSVISAHGSIYAIRRELYEPVPAYVTDDFAISTAVIEHGRRLVFDAEAIAFEEATTKSAHEFRRKVRMMSRGFRALVLRRRLFNPFHHGFYSLVIFSHKLLRRLAPMFLLAMLIASAILIDRATVYRIAVIVQLGFYLLALTGLGLTRTWLGSFKVFSIPLFYCMANAAALIALCKVVCGARVELWQPERERI